MGVDIRLSPNGCLDGYLARAIRMRNQAESFSPVPAERNFSIEEKNSGGDVFSLAIVGLMGVRRIFILSNVKEDAI